ncbi:MAG: DUF2157 domain-containing protein [Saprospiraceae bacterium]|nr:DUF2157 domain-containing protein [Saprospiraceae bacterium]
MENDLIHKWLSEGLINDTQANAMRADINQAVQEQSSNRFLSIISVLGSIFLGIGVIWIIAANWDGMGDIIKILLLLAATGGSIYVGYDLGFQKKTFPKTGHALVLLGGILFGASIFLIAQIYNVQAHASYLLFLWLVGIIPLMYIFQSALITFLSCVVFCIWYNSLLIHDMEQLEDGNISMMIFFYQVFGVFLFSLGSLHYFSDRFHKIARTMRLIGIFLTICILFIFTFQFLHLGIQESEDLTIDLFQIVLLFGLILVMLGVNYKYNPSKSETNVLENRVAAGILSAMFLFNLTIGYAFSYYIFWLIFNVLFVGLVIVLYRVGYARKDMKLVNIASFGIFFFIFFKFFDFFSDYLDSGFTWMLFGILLLVGSIRFEKKRRSIRDSFKSTANEILEDD